MNAWTYQAPNPITSFLIGIELSGVIPASTMRSVSSLHPQFKRDFPRKIEQPTFSFSFPGQGGIPMGGQFGFQLPATSAQPHVGNIVFDRVQEDGTVAKAISVGPNRITFMTSTYSRWEEFQPISERLVKTMTQLVLPDVGATALLLSVTNQFVPLNADATPRLNDILNAHSKYISSNMLDCDGHCHSFHGYLTTLQNPSGATYTRNINVSTLDDAEGKRVLTILFQHRIVFLSALGEESTLFVDRPNRPSLFSELSKMMHDSNNELFKDLISPSVAQKIPGLT